VDLWGAPDLVYEGARGEVRVVDWKTGKERPTDRTQLDLYALWLMERDTVTPDRDIRATADYLRTGISREHVPNPDRALERIAGMLGELRKHVDGRNKPNIEPARWPKLAEGSKACGWCEYRRLCRR
jgi:CRISPR/Cas system-associated exonuclease Cas4 (RecB family)